MPASRHYRIACIEFTLTPEQSKRLHEKLVRAHTGRTPLERLL